MAYDRNDTRDAPRNERSRWPDERDRNHDGRRDERGFFERAGDEVSSWFGDEDAERRRREDRMRDQRESGWSGRDPDRDRDRGRADHDRDRDRNRDRDRDWYQTRGLNERGGWSESDYNPSWRRELGDRDRSFRDRDRNRGYRPVTGDYGRGSDHESEQFFAASGVGHGERGFGGYERENRFERDRSESEWGRDPYRRTSRAGTSDWSDRSRHEDPHYQSWRQRHMSELDRDYDDYRRENQSRFEDDFAGWRERRQQKRGMLDQVREHMEVVGNDQKHVGTVDCTKGDRLILTKSDPESGGVHHSLSCSDIDRVEGDRVILDCSADQARERWRDERSGRALFEREDQGEMGPRMLDRSFEGTYRR
ncbi:MAG TPA: DUF2171 domain-containing protein [Sphingomicrobium sp.]|nr:DUF2171 domain-containing protein [Sphingomicrobium sp.]